MMCLIQSQNYVWNLKDILGFGATGSVFQGNHNVTGDLVAVKTFNGTSKSRPLDVQMREFEVLKKCNHENIVKLLAIETVINTNSRVIITESCNGGSLQKILSDPKNVFGLKQTEILLILKDLTAGLKYLHENSIVHRDIKPGNIMKYISDDKQIIYKLVDFGAARELENDNESYLSIYGTDEYLHPAVYERAHINPTVNNKFQSNYDLWSIGVTLYHIATGNLPFRPFGGRRNPQQMQLMTSKKSIDIISAVQYYENESIIYSNELPINCSLGNSFKRILTPLLRDLLQAKPENMLTLDKFFERVQNIINKIIIHIFCMNSLKLIEIFLNPTDRYEDLLYAIESETNVQAENQILLYGNNYLVTKVGVNTEVKDYPNIDADNPIFFYIGDNNNVQIPEKLKLPEFPKFSDSLNVKIDSKTAHMTCGFAHIIQRKIDEYTVANSLLNSGVEQLTETYKYSLTNLLRKINNFEEILTTVIGLLDLKINNYSAVSELKAATDDLKRLKSDFGNATKQAESLFHKNVTKNTLSKNWKEVQKDKKWPLQHRASQRANTLIEQLRNSWQKLVDDSQKMSLTYEEGQFNSLEKNKIYENVKRLKFLFYDDVESGVKQMYNYFADWYKMAQIVYVQSQILNKDFLDMHNRYRDICDNIYQFGNDMKNQENLQNGNLIVKDLEKELKVTINEWINIQDESKNVLQDSIELNLEMVKLQKNFMNI